MVNLVEGGEKNRPISPHLGIYKPQISTVLSIFHRISGVALFGAFSLISWWFILWVFSSFDPYYIELLDCWMADLVLYGTSYAFFYHLCTGIRRLKWDMGCGFSIKAINYSGWAAVIVSLLLTIIFWIFI